MTGWMQLFEFSNSEVHLAQHSIGRRPQSTGPAFPLLEQEYFLSQIALSSFSFFFPWAHTTLNDKGMEKMELKSEDNKGENRRRRRVGLIHDERMCKHFAPDDDYHPENPNRILAIWNKLKSSGITQRSFSLSSMYTRPMVLVLTPRVGLAQWSRPEIQGFLSRKV